MNKDRTTYYAIKRLKELARYELNGLNGINLYKDTVSIEFSNGMQFQLSNKEIKRQSLLFLEGEIQSILDT